MKAVPGALREGLLRTLFCFALSFAALPSADAAEQAGTLEVDVGSGPLAPALQQWARQVASPCCSMRVNWMACVRPAPMANAMRPRP